MKTSDIKVGRLYTHSRVQGKAQVRRVVRICTRGELRNKQSESAYLNKQMVEFKKYYGDKGFDFVTLEVFARWAERELVEHLEDDDYRLVKNNSFGK